MEDTKFLLTLTDGGILDIEANIHAHGGCPTCGYGTEYFTAVNIKLSVFTLYCNITADRYDAISIGDLMKVFLPNVSDIQKLSELKFIEWFRLEICKIVGADNAEFRVKL